VALARELGTDTRKTSDERLQAGVATQEQAIDAQRNAVQRFQVEQSGSRVVVLLLMGMALLLAPAAQAAGADGGAVVSGVVRDAQGVAQMGALVQVLTGNAVTVATAFTDQHGRYFIGNLNPGMYLVRASATLLVPATRANLQLRTGATAVVNLTLTALFDTVSWLPAERRRADEPDDEWKWTLRSTANRPILRIMQDGDLIEVSTSSVENAATEKMRARATVASGDGEFGGGGVHNILAIHRMLDDGSDMAVRSDIGTPMVGTGFGPSQELDAGVEKRLGYSGAARTVVSYKSHPELLAAGSPAGLQVGSVASARRMSLGEFVAVEAGGSMQMVNAGQVGMATHPFLRLTTHPMGVWTLHYRIATDRQVQGFEDVTTGQAEIPVALVKNGKLALESGRHQEAAIERKAGRGTVLFAYYHDAIGQMAIAGGVSGPGATIPGQAISGPAGASHLPAGMMVDPTTGTFRTLTNGYKTSGTRLTVSTPLMDGLWVAAEYSTGDAVASETGPLTLFPAALAGMKSEMAETGTLALKGRIKASGTRIRTSYRWQPSKLVSAVDPYSAFGDQAFFSCQLKQPIRWGARLPSGLDATIDVTNLLAQGYRPFLSADGQTLYFAQAPRTIQGGVSFTF
jgi:hypothetical protein